MTSSFGQRLKAARVMRGLSMDRLVEKMEKRISKQAVSKYENDLMKPDSSVVVELCRALDLSADFFFPQSSIELSRLNFRKKRSFGAKSIASVTETVRDVLERYIEIESLLRVVSLHTNPLAGTVVASDKETEEAALRLRNSWGVGPAAPIAGVVALLEDHQVKVIEVRGFDGFDGLSGEADGRPFVVLRGDAPTDRKRLTAFHEYAHLSLDFAEGLSEREREKLCHDFAASVLLPREVLFEELGRKRSDISFFEIGSIKKEYGLSMQAIVYRAHHTGIISDYTFQHLNVEFNGRGWKKSEPIVLETEEHPFQFHQLVHRAYAEEVISVSKAAFLAGNSIEDFRKEVILDAENSSS